VLENLKRGRSNPHKHSFIASRVPPLGMYSFPIGRDPPELPLVSRCEGSTLLNSTSREVSIAEPIIGGERLQESGLVLVYPLRHFGIMSLPQQLILDESAAAAESNFATKNDLRQDVSCSSWEPTAEFEPLKLI
jgi:hypothetical protein